MGTFFLNEIIWKGECTMLKKQHKSGNGQDDKTMQDKQDAALIRKAIKSKKRIPLTEVRKRMGKKSS